MRTITLPFVPWELPECKERGCVVTSTYDIGLRRTVYQHGDNPEAVLIVTDTDRMQDNIRGPHEIIKQVQDFAHRCHEYEDHGVQPDE